jgi:hypothetical protein
MEECTAWKAYTARMYREREKPLDTPIGPWLGKRKDLPNKICIVTKKPCLVENLDVRAGNVCLPITISEGMIET